MTTPSALLQTSDVEGLLGETLTDTETAQVDSLIDFAQEKLRSPKVRAVIGDVDERIAAGELAPGFVKGVLVTVVCRAFDALRVGLRVRSEQFPELQTVYADPNLELVYFTDAELASLEPEASSDVFGSGAFTIRIG
ncbi:hypothetical protein M1M07_07700 [Rhodococcus sp. HM1]|uniref:hypothetical protein n=1 Tax=Rhodococcus sp. HM1 TaxID=2937759 RepID=UPI00200A6921|nr:hypothetical protein [Rhodococcus sp. HM1]MCK8671001.1 hypothetical protein [Rhodococcus sp. HM1]